MLVNDFRLSVVWVEAVPEALGSTDPGKLGKLVRQDDYAPFFRSVLKQDDDPLVAVPWPRAKGQLFPEHNNYWTNYIIQQLRDASRGDPGVMAWRAAVPFAVKKAPARIEGKDRCFLDGWIHPHGIALCATAWFRAQQFTLADFRRAARNFLRGDLDAVLPDGSKARIHLDDLAKTCLTELRTIGFDTAVTAGFQPDPIRILTIVRGEWGPGETDSADARKAVLAAAVEGLGGDPDAPLKQTGHVYLLPRGRIVWRADKALSDEDRLHTLGCLHRNVTQATMQTASVVRCAEVLSSQFQAAGNTLPSRCESYAGAIAGLIGRLYGGKQTYALECLRDQIAEANDQGAMDTLRHQFAGLPPLKP